MDIDLYPPLEIHSGTFNIVVAPVEMIVHALESIVGPRQFLVIYISGNYSRVLSRINPRIADFEIRRAFTAFQLLSILEEIHHSLVFVEHDPALYEDFEEPLEVVAMAMKDLASRSTIVLYSPKIDPTLNAISKLADRVFYLGERAHGRSGGDGPLVPSSRDRRSKRNSSSNVQSTLEVF